MTTIIKASGEKAPFDPMKIRRSLRRVGTDEQLIDDIVNEVTQSLREGMTTHEIYRITFRLLHKKSKVIAAKYHLKRAIMQLGISGFPFEKYVAELLRHQGLETQTNQMIEGYCIHHEVDVVAKQEKKIIYVECKYHNLSGIKCDVKIPLYFKARFLDIEQSVKVTKDRHLEGWLVTNTRFTDDALKYGVCAGLHLISWDYPEKGSLREQIEISGLYPITCLTNLTKSEISQLMANDIVLCKSISHHPTLLDPLRIPKMRRESIINQCHALDKHL